MRKKIVAVILLTSLSIGLIFGIVMLMRYDDPLTIAARNVDTITMNIVYDEATQSLAINQRVDFRNRTPSPKSELKFHIFANAFREGAAHPPVAPHEIRTAFLNGVQSFGRIDISHVFVNGQPVDVVLGGEDENVLVVSVELGVNETARVDIDYVVHLANIAHRLGWTDRVVNLGNFYPVPVIKQDGAWKTNVYSYNGDPFFNALHNFDVTIRKPKAMILASSGKRLRESTSGNYRTTRVQSQAIRDWAAVLSRDFSVTSRMVNRVAVHYFYLDDANPLRSLETSVRSLETFSRLFVQYPYRQLTVVQTDFLHGGMEFGEIVFISSTITEREEIDRVIIHEIAHQWWYGIIGNDQFRHAWIDEGLAEFSTLLFFDENPDMAPKPRNYWINMFRTNFATFSTIVTSLGGTVNITMNRDLTAFKSQIEYVYMAYIRGMLLFSDLERIIGRYQMLVSLRNLAQENKFGIVTPEILVQTFESTTNFHLAMFFTSYTNSF